MRIAIWAMVFLWGQSVAQRPDMVAATVTHHQQEHVVHDDDVQVTCPAGYEGHFVDYGIGFNGEWYMVSGGYSSSFQPPPGYVICFSSEFMNKVRANPELLRFRPLPPRGV